MDLDELQGRNFLDELYRQTKGDTTVQVSMYEVGAALGLNKGEAGSLAESLIVDGLVELKTLAGGIGITNEGLTSLGIAAPAGPVAGATFSLSHGPVATEQDRQTIAELIRQIKDSLPGRTLPYDCLEEIVIDLKTVELHLLSPKPKIAVLRELFRSLHDALAAAGIKETATVLKAVVG